MVALERCIDMTFSKRIQNISKWKDLLQRENHSLHETFCKLSYIACLEIPLLLLTLVHTMHNSNKKSSRVRLHKNNLWQSSILNWDYIQFTSICHSVSAPALYFINYIEYYIFFIVNTSTICLNEFNDA